MKRLGIMLLVVACNGGVPTEGGVSKAAYVTQAETICTDANAKQKSLKSPTSVEMLAPYVTQVTAIADETATRIASLTPPKADAADLQTKVLGPLHEQLSAGHAYAGKVAAASDANDLTTLSSLLHNPPKTQVDLRWMKSYGFSACIDAVDASG